MLADRSLLQLLLKPGPDVWFGQELQKLPDLRGRRDVVDGLATRAAQSTAPEQQKKNSDQSHASTAF